MSRKKAPPTKARQRRTFDRVQATGMRQVVDHRELSERDSRILQELLENPPPANVRLRAAAADLP